MYRHLTDEQLLNFMYMNLPEKEHDAIFDELLDREFFLREDVLDYIR